PHRDRDRERVHQARQRGALLRHLQEDLADAVVRVLARGDVALGVADLERDGPSRTGRREPLLLRPRDRWGSLLVDLRVRLLLGAERLADLAVVPVDRDRLQAELPSL